jgi:hypothetical protein
MKKLLVITFSLVLLVGGSVWAQASITLDSVNVEAIYSKSADPGYTNFESFGDSLRTGEEIILYMRYTNESGKVIDGLSNGYRIYTVDMGGDGAAVRNTMWDGVVFIDPDTIIVGTDTTINTRDTVPVADTIIVVGQEFANAFDQTFVNYYHADGVGADTVCYSGFLIFQPGLSSTYDEVAIAVHIGPIAAVPESHGDSLCVDSTWFPPSNHWLWAPAGGGDLVPDWDGPYCWLIIDEATSAGLTDVSLGEKPETFQLNQNYPNPFNPVTTISFDVGRAGHVKLDVYNVLGQRVASLVDRHMERGTYEAEWEASSFSTGIYFYKLETESFSDTKKMLLLK